MYVIYYVCLRANLLLLPAKANAHDVLTRDRYDVAATSGASSSTHNCDWPSAP